MGVKEGVKVSVNPGVEVKVPGGKVDVGVGVIVGV